MSRVREAAVLLQDGQAVDDIPELMGISFASVKQYLLRAVNEGLIRRSDIAFSVKHREVIEQAISEVGADNWFPIYRWAGHTGCELNTDVLKWYLQLRASRVSLGDMYEHISDIEITLHQAIKALLIQSHGTEAWWRDGVPMQIRVDCAARLERDSEPASEPYAYTDFIHLQEIIDRQWSLFSRHLPPALVADKRQFLASLRVLNRIRSGVMHPIKRIPLTEYDFAFVRKFRADMHLARWRQMPVFASA
jgi:hypothetical protein